MSTTQTKLLSAATVLSTLADNDNMLVVTEAGQTGLVSKTTLKNEIGLGWESGSASNSPVAGQWERIASLNPSGAGIVFINNRYSVSAPEPIILLVGGSYYSDRVLLKTLGSNANLFSKARIVEYAWGAPLYLEIQRSRATTDSTSVMALGIGLSALTPAVNNSTDTPTILVEIGLTENGGGNSLIFNTYQNTFCAERRAA